MSLSVGDFGRLVPTPPYGWNVAQLDFLPMTVDATGALNTAGGGGGGGLTDAQLRASAVPVSLASVPSHAVTNAGTFLVQVSSAPTTAVTGTFWQTTQPVSGTFWQTTQPVSIAATVATKELRAATAVVTSVSDSATSVTVLAANANRLGCMIFNDSTSTLYLKCGTTASLTDFTVKVLGAGYFEMPYHYTGRIDGIWSADSTGAARVTELS